MGRYESNLLSVTEILDMAGLTDYFNIPDKEYYFSLGHAVDYATQLVDENNLGECEEVVLPYMEGYKNFLNDTGFEILHNQKHVMSVLYGFQGTLDKVGKLWKHRVVIDTKCSAICEPWYHWQTAGYMIGYNEEYKQPNSVQKRYILNLHPSLGERKYKLTPCKNENDLSIFKAAIVIARARKENKLWKPQD